MRVGLALLALIILFSPARAQNGNVIYQRDYATWRVVCTKDAMSDQVECLVGAFAQGTGDNRASVFIWSMNKNAEPALSIEMPYYLIMLERGLTIRSDSNEPRTFSCTDIQKQRCTIQGSDRDWLLNDWRSASKVVMRSYMFSEPGPDYTLDMQGFGDAFADFSAAVAQYL